MEPKFNLWIEHNGVVVLSEWRVRLLDAIDQGGTTLRDFVREDGTPGYFSVRLRVYGKGGTACPNCGTGILLTKIRQRASYYCPRCQR